MYMTASGENCTTSVSNFARSFEFLGMSLITDFTPFDSKADARLCLNLKNAVESRKSTQHLDAPDKTKNTLFTTQVTTVFLISSCTSICYASFSRSTAFSRLKECIKTGTRRFSKRVITNILSTFLSKAAIFCELIE